MKDKQDAYCSIRSNGKEMWERNNLNMKRLQRKQYTQMRTSNNKQHQYTMTRKKMPDWRHLFICISLSLYQSKANTKKMASYIVKVRWVPVKGSVKKWQNFSLFTSHYFSCFKYTDNQLWCSWWTPSKNNNLSDFLFEIKNISRFII